MLTLSQRLDSIEQLLKEQHGDSTPLEKKQLWTRAELQAYTGWKGRKYDYHKNNIGYYLATEREVWFESKKVLAYIRSRKVMNKIELGEEASEILNRSKRKTA